MSTEPSTHDTVVFAAPTKSEFIPITPPHHRCMRYIVGNHDRAADATRVALARFTRDITGDTKLTAAVYGGSTRAWDLDPNSGRLALSLRFPNYTSVPDPDNPFAPTHNSWAIEFHGGPAHGEQRAIKQGHHTDTMPTSRLGISTGTAGEEPTTITYRLTCFNLATRRWVYTTEETS